MSSMVYQKQGVDTSFADAHNDFYMKRVDPLKTLRAMAVAAPSQRALAVELGISDAYLCDLLNGRRHFSKTILDKLGMEQVIIRRSSQPAA